MSTPVLFALISAFLFALTNHFQSIGLKGADVRSGSLVNIATGAAMYWLAAPFFLEGGYWWTWGFICFAVVGLFRPSLSSWLALSSIARMGPTLTSALTASAPIFGAGLAILILNERLTLATTIGTLAVVAGAVVATMRPDGVARGWPLWALVLPFGAAFIRAAGHVGTKLGLGDVPSPSFAVLVGNTVSLVLVAAAFFGQGQRITGRMSDHKWFVMAGIAAGSSLHFLNSALAAGSVVTVVPIVSAAPVFTLLLGLLVFRNEAFSLRTAATIALVVPGVVLVALSGR
ncbi:MAG TPA: EamA family transporter [Hyphomicrobiaceae bacterium]|nr:EamA family transporter [Hyphomicrobiaceae bacterium]